MGAIASNITPIIKNLGLRNYETVWQAMQDFTQSRDKNTSDEFWIVEHPAVFTLGRNGKPEHILTNTSIPIVKVDRGGQVTYHGPGQLVIYVLLDLHRRHLGIRKLVTILEDSIIILLKEYKVEAHSDKKAPGVYINGEKIAALGLRVSKGCTTHGLSLNVDMDMTPYQNINPCGYQNLKVTQCRDHQITDSLGVLAGKLSELLQQQLKKAHLPLK